MRKRVHLLLILTLLFPLLASRPVGAEDPARELLAEMSPAERVGQLFIVSYVGSDVGPNSAIARLIREERVGGLVLLAANQNFINDETAPFQVRESTQQLQSLALANGSLPLLIAIDHEGDGWPYSRLTGGTTPLPSPMAVGATWDVDLAREMGRITGQELAGAGINMILGPSVDVLNSPRTTSKGDLGTRVFGGDPYWVGRMGRAYIEGVHEGGDNRVATVAKHFPGHGNSDRLPDDEVATVDKSLQELRRMELAPFFAVTRYDDPEDPAVTDALMSSHIRYRGFQGNIRQFTAPISFDPQGLRTILAETEFMQWREEGVLMSDSLGVPAVKKYFDPTAQTFPHRQIARDALMAGNDLLILAQYSLDGSWSSQLANMRDTLAYFREQYAADRTFAQRVDEAALKVIRMKLRLYPEFAEGDRSMPPLPEPRFGEGEELTRAVAEEALTLLFPRSLEELNDRLPRAPLRGEPIVIFTDARAVRDCFDCPYYQLLPTDALQKAILRRYGPEGTNQITEAQIISFSFDDLKLYLGAPGVIEGSEDPEAAQERAGQVRALVEGAQWILLVMQDINLSPVSGSQLPRYPESDAARLLLDAASGSLFNKKVVAFAFNVPYQLDTTEISKLSAAFALYSKQETFIDVAARALFRDIVPQGAPPVTVEAVNYDLATQLEPEPDQPISLERLTEGPLVAPTEVEVQTSLILDRNGNPVPDGTSVDFVGSWRNVPDAGEVKVSATTVDGVARAIIPLTRPGVLEIRVHLVAVQAWSDRALLLSVTSPEPTPTVTSEIPPTEEGSPPLLGEEAGGSRETLGMTSPVTTGRADDLLSLEEFLFGLLGTIVAVGTAWWMTATWPLVGRVRITLMAVIGGMGGYLLWGAIGAVGGLLLAGPVAVVGGLMGLGVGWRLPE